MCVVACLMRIAEGAISPPPPLLWPVESFERPYPADVSSTQRKENRNGICASLWSGVRSDARRPSRCDRVTGVNTTREYGGLRENKGENRGLRNELAIHLERIYQLYETWPGSFSFL